MTQLVKITGAKIYDPTNGESGVARDLWIRGHLICEPPKNNEKPTRTIDASGYIIFPGGIDMHSHVAGAKVNTGRAMLPELRRKGEKFAAHLDNENILRRSGSLGIVPTTFATGYKYAGLGYTTVFDAAVAPLLSRVAHRDLQEIPCVQSGCYLLVGNDRRLLELISAKRQDAARDYLAWLLKVGRGYAPKVVNPGGVESWKHGIAHDQNTLDTEVPGLAITPRTILQSLARATNDLKLPHPIHIHCNQLGRIGNWTTTLETMKLLDGLHAHLTHIQFHSYLGTDPKSSAADRVPFGSAVEKLVEQFNKQKTLSVDVGQVIFGPTISMTGDSAAAQYLARLTGARRYNHDLECVGGCGVMPVEYKNKSVVHAWQFAIGLEWYLLADDPWRIALTTDHPNGGVFWAYPQLVRLLMDANYRHEVLQTLPRAVRENSQLKNLKREYTLDEICIITRSGPAKLLGLSDRGHLAPGARADITIYSPQENKEEMFQSPIYTIQAGQITVERGVIISAPRSALPIKVDLDTNTDVEAELRPWFKENMSVELDQFAFAGE